MKRKVSRQSIVLLTTLIIVFSSLIHAQPKQAGETKVLKKQFQISSNSSFRGLCTVNDKVVWVSGNNGTFLRTVDGGKNWLVDSIPGATKLDFRDIEAFDENTALVISAGVPGKIYKTTDGGQHWVETYSNTLPSIFFNGFDFWDEKNGMAVGDPIDGKAIIIHTSDGGESWQTVHPSAIPEKLAIEAGFAASGTGIVTKGKNKVWIGLGGTKARIFFSEDRGINWRVINTPLLSGNASRGIYSMCFRDEKNGIAVGGAWNENTTEHSKAYTVNGGLSWSEGKGVQAYRSGSCFVANDIYLATGPSGTDITFDSGKNWTMLDNEGFNAIETSPGGKFVYAVGAKGKVVRLTLITMDGID